MIKKFDEISISGYYHAGRYILRDTNEMDKKIEAFYRQMPDIDIDSIDIVEEAKEWLYHHSIDQQPAVYLIKGLIQKVEEQWDCMEQLDFARERIEMLKKELSGK